MLSHGSSKVILFLAAGLLYAKMGITEIRQLAGARQSWPQIAILLSLASFSLMGIPFLSGGVVKGLIAEGIDDELSIFLPIIQIFTASYSVRIIYYCFKSSKTLASEHCASKKCDSIWGLFVFYFLAEGFLLSYMIRKNSIIFDVYLYLKFIAILALGAFSAYCLNYVAKFFEGKSLLSFNYSGECFWSLKHEIVNINVDSRIELMFIIGGLVLLLI
jgi:formate hydrogenlyase subunit 3/multisubunit Na+/H+ antiporter MnhD subunit